MNCSTVVYDAASVETIWSRFKGEGNLVLRGLFIVEFTEIVHTGIKT